MISRRRRWLADTKVKPGTPDFEMKTGFFEQQTSVRLRRMCLAIVASLLCTFSAAQQLATPVDENEAIEEDLRRYTVELIVFSYGDSASTGTEIFAPEPVEETPGPVEPVLEPLATAAFDPDVGRELIDEEPIEEYIPEFGDFVEEYLSEELVEIVAGDTVDLKVLMPEELTMTAVHDKLVLLDAYQPVMWAGWRQATLAEEETPQIKLRRLGNIGLEFDGVFKLYLSRFLHLVVDITMDEEPAPRAAPELRSTPGYFGRRYPRDFDDEYAEITADPVVRYRIFEDRIVKNGDIRYFDHPKFGLVVKVSRYEKTEEEENAEKLIRGGMLSNAN